MKALLFFFICAGLISCTKDNGSTKTTTPKTTGHIYCSIMGNSSLYIFGRPSHDTLTFTRTSDFDISLIQQGANIFSTQSKKDSVTVDLGEWNPGNYEIQCAVSFIASRRFVYNMQCDTSFQVQANVDQTIKLDEWYQ